MSFHIHESIVRLTGILYLLLSLLPSSSSIADPSVAERTYPKRVWQAKNLQRWAWIRKRLTQLLGFLKDEAVSSDTDLS